MRTRLLWGAMLAVCIAPAALAQTSSGASDEAVWSVAGKQVLRLHGTVGGMTPQQRVDTLDGRLTDILSQGEAKLGAEDITLKSDGEVTILVRDKLLVTVTQPDADANHASRVELGKRWLANLRKTLPLLAPRVNTHGA